MHLFESRSACRESLLAAIFESLAATDERSAAHRPLYVSLLHTLSLRHVAALRSLAPRWKATKKRALRPQKQHKWLTLKTNKRLLALKSNTKRLALGKRKRLSILKNTKKGSTPHPKKGLPHTAHSQFLVHI